MSEYWKSTPKYWCKHCSTYVRDTKLERTNHEATGKHQGALKRFLRDLHRGHDQEQREKDRAKREIDRLNGVVGASTSVASSSATAGTGAASSSSSKGPTGGGGRIQAATEGQRQKQWEQLAEMGIDVPTEIRGDMAMAGEWTVTNTRIVDHTPRSDDTEGNPAKAGAIATGVRKRTQREDGDEEEEENTIKGLFKKPRKWGRDTRQAPENDAELDALLNGSLTTNIPKKEEEQDPTKEEPSPLPGIKKEESEEGSSKALSEIAQPPSGDVSGDANATPVKQEDVPESEAPAVVFKKRKPKNIRQK